MLGLIRKPIEIGIALAGGAIGLVRSNLLGDDDERPGPVDSPARPDPAKTGWDPDAPVQPGGSNADDLIVRDRVQTEIFRPGDAEKGNVSVNVENGVVFLRGQVEDPDQGEYFEIAAAAVDGVVRVENLIDSAP